MRAHTITHTHTRMHNVFFTAHCMKRFMRPLYLNIGAVYHDHLAEVVSTRFLYCKVTFVFNIYLGWDTFRLRKLYISSNFCPLIFSTYQYGLTEIYIILQINFNTEVIYLILLLIFFQLSPLRAPSGWILCSFQKFPSIWGHFLTFWHNKIFQVHLVFPASGLESITSLKSLSSFYWRILFGNQVWALGVSLWVECYCFTPFQWTEPGNVCICSSLCIHIYLHFCTYHCVCVWVEYTKYVCICEKDTHNCTTMSFYW